MVKELLRRDKEAGAAPDATYMAMVGSLLYVAMVSRPDIALAVQVLGRSLQASTQEHITAAKRVMRYLKGTSHLTLRMGASVRSHCDADYAGDRQIRRSVTALVFMLNGGAISWASKLQPTVALSTAEAEYMSLCAGTHEAVYLRRLLVTWGSSRTRQGDHSLRGQSGVHRHEQELGRPLSHTAQRCEVSLRPREGVEW